MAIQSDTQTPSNPAFTAVQKEYLQGFFAGVAQRGFTPFVGETANGLITADAASDEVASPAARAAGSPFGGLDEVVVLTCAMPLADERFRTLLTQGGRMFVFVGEPPVQEARLLRRMGDNEWQRTVLFETCIDPLLNARHAPGFKF